MPKLPFRSPLPDAETVLSGLTRPSLARLRLDRFAPGADNRRVDVALGPTLVRATEVYVRTLVHEAVQRAWRQPVQAFSDAAQTSFFGVVEQHHDAVIKEPPGDTRVDRMQLFQLALLKLALARVAAGLSGLKSELEEARGRPGRQSDGRNLELHRQAVTLAQQERHIRYQVLRRMMREWMRQEHTRFSKARQRVLGAAWPAPEAMIANPLVQLDGLGEIADFARHYHPSLFDEATAAAAVESLLGVLADLLPANVAVAPGPSTGVASQSGGQDMHSTALFGVEPLVRRLYSPADLADGKASWLDAPENVVALLGGSGAKWPDTSPWRANNIDRLQRQLNRKLERTWQKSRLLQDIAAGYTATAVQAGLALPGLGQLVFDYLRGDLRRRELKRKLTGIDGVDAAGPVLRRIEQMQRELGDYAGMGRHQLVARFAGECLRFRRDLKLFWRLHSALDRIRLVVDERERMLATDKEQMQVFCRADSGVTAKGNVVGHAVVTAELRGISELVEMMRLRNMHPAGYFSRHLYDPIAYVLEKYGAEKLASGGNLLSAGLFDHAGDRVERAPVARACCLAVAIVATIDEMNRESERIGLPRLEAGLGIAHADRAPTYLFDQERKFAVSPAVDRARELASCHLLLRRNCRLPQGRGLCVARPIEDDGDPQAALMRYNVFGIELDGDAFSQLHVELALRRIRARDRRADSRDLLHVGSCADMLGEGHLVLVRERPVRLWMGNRLLEAQQDERRYYEVVTDQRLRERVQQRLGGGRPLQQSLSAGTAGPFSRESDLP